MLGLIVPLLFPIFFPGLLLVPFAVWMLIDCWTHPRLGPAGRTAWSLGMASTFGLAGLFYFWIVRPSRHEAAAAAATDRKSPVVTP